MLSTVHTLSRVSRDSYTHFTDEEAESLEVEPVPGAI